MKKKTFTYHTDYVIRKYLKIAIEPKNFKTVYDVKSKIIE